MAITWSKEQLDAINVSGRNIIVSAAAGSGKTAVLIERIYQKLLSGVDIDRLLVVTFTRAAAAEMKERIGAKIRSGIDSVTDAEARRLLYRQQMLLENASIKTLHSFCSDIVRNNFQLLDIDPDYRLADTAELELLKLEVLDDVLEEKYNEASPAFLDLADCYGRGRDDSLLRSMILDLASAAITKPSSDWLESLPQKLDPDLSFQYSPIYTELSDYIIQKLNTILKTYYSNMDHLCGLYDELVYTLQCTADTRKSDAAKLKSITEKSEAASRSYDQAESILVELKDNEDMRKEYDEYSYGNLPYSWLRALLMSLSSKDSGLYVPSPSEGIIKENKYLYASLSKCKKQLAALYENFFSQDESNVVASFDPMKKYASELCDTTEYFLLCFKRAKKKRGIIDFNDLEHFALELLYEKDSLCAADGKKQKPVPSPVAMYYRNFFEEVMVDEYQDSNMVQELILRAVSRCDQCRAPFLFMVGDVKQSIYRFRHAVPQLFNEKCACYASGENYKATSPGYRIDLNKNFRSSSRIIDAVNSVFSSVMSNDVGDVCYDEHHMLYCGRTDNFTPDYPPISFYLAEKTSKTASDSNLFDEDGEEVECEIGMILDIIRSTVGKTMVFDSSMNCCRPAVYGDIAILMRVMKGKGSRIKDCLTAAGIPSYLETADAYLDRYEIRVALSALRIIDNPLQDIPLISVISSAMFDFSPDMLTRIKKYSGGKYFYNCVLGAAEAFRSAPELLSDSERQLCSACAGFDETLNKWRHLSTVLPVDELIWHIVKTTGFYSVMGMCDDGEIRQANLRLLFVYGGRYRETGFKGLFRFIKFVDKLIENKKDMEAVKTSAEDVVQIMSIHKSKGLEFPIVILADSFRTFSSQDTTKNNIIHSDLGLGLKLVNPQLHISADSFPRAVIKNKVKCENLSEEMRILYVALTRAKERIFVTGALRNARSKVASLSSFDVGTDEFKNMIAESSSYAEWLLTALLASKIFKHDLVEMKLYDFSDSTLYTFARDLHFPIFKAEGKIGGFEVITSSQPPELDVIQDETVTDIVFVPTVNTAASAPAFPSKVSVTELEKYIAPLTVEDVAPLFASDESRAVLGATPHDTSAQSDYLNRADASVQSACSEHAGNAEQPVLAHAQLPDYLKAPDFMRNVTVTPVGALRGTANHTFLRHIDYASCTSRADLTAQGEKMQSAGLLTADELSSVNISGISSFIFDTDTGALLRSTGIIHKETPFTLAVDIDELVQAVGNASLPEVTLQSFELSKPTSGNRTLMQGIIDCWIESPEGITVIDFKTGRGSADAAAKYKLQMLLYGAALKRITGCEILSGRIVYIDTNFVVML